MSEINEDIESKKYLKTNRVSKVLIITLNVVIWASYLTGHTTTLETAGLFSVSLCIVSILLRMAITQLKATAIQTNYIDKNSSDIFAIMHKFSNDLMGTHQERERVEFRKNNSLLTSRMDATATMLFALILTGICWLIFAIKVIF